MNLLEMLGRKPRPAVPAAATALNPATATKAAPKSTAIQPPAADPPAPSTRYSALVLVADEFLHRQLDDLFSSAGKDWSWERAATVMCARQLCEQRSFSIIVTEGRVAGESVIGLLNELHASRPGMLRYIYGAPPPAEDLKQLLGLRPAVINTKNRKEMILAQFERELVVESWLANQQARQLIAKFRNLPSVPTIYNQVIAELESPTGSLDEVARLIAQDLLMTAKILQVVNSAIFAPSTPITRAEEAVLLLGTQRTQALVLAVPMFTKFESAACPGVTPDQLWQHCMEVAGFARAIALRAGHHELADAAFTAGLLHDIGKLLLAANLMKEYAEVHRRSEALGVPVVQVEREQFGTTHAEAAACLFGMWGLPLPVLEAIAHHHQPLRSEHDTFTPLTAVHAANAFFYERRKPDVNKLDRDYAARLGLLEARNAWRLACGLPARFEEASLGDRIRMRQDARTN
jgi:putative nucleotidyltransferase with HDIG domain